MRPLLGQDDGVAVEPVVTPLEEEPPPIVERQAQPIAVWMLLGLALVLTYLLALILLQP